MCGHALKRPPSSAYIVSGTLVALVPEVGGYNNSYFVVFSTDNSPPHYVCAHFPPGLVLLAFSDGDAMRKDTWLMAEVYGVSGASLLLSLECESSELFVDGSHPSDMSSWYCKWQNASALWAPWSTALCW